MADTRTVRCARCPHHRDAHTHLRGGTDCALCACPRWRHPARRWATTLTGAIAAAALLAYAITHTGGTR